MADRVQKRRGTTSQHSTFTGVVGEITVDTDKDTAVVHDGSTAGGFPLAREDVNNVSNPQFGGTSTLKVPTGTQAQRPVSPSQGQVRFNTDTDKLEYYANGTATWQATQETGTALFTDNAGGTLSIAIGSTSGYAYPHRSTDGLSRIADANDTTQFSNRMFTNIAANNDFENAGVSFSSSNNSFTVSAGYSVSILVGWSVDEPAHSGWNVNLTDDWGGVTDQINFETTGAGEPTHREERRYTAKGPGTFSFGGFVNDDAATGASADLDMDYIEVSGAVFTANVSA